MVYPKCIKDTGSRRGNMEKYAVIDKRTGTQKGKEYTSRRRARSRADALDLSYGAYRYIVKLIEVV